MFAVIFDMDGVIFDTEKIWKETFHKTAKRLNLPLTEQFRQQTCGKKMERVRADLIESFGDVGAKFVDEWVHCFHLENEAYGAALKDGFLQMMDFLKRVGAKTALATGSSMSATNRNFAKAGLDAKHFFDEILTSEKVEKGKPNPEIYIKAAQALGQDAANCFVLEDSPNGIVAASEAGCKVVMVIDLIQPTDELRKRCVAVCENLWQAQNVLENYVKF